MWRRERQAQRPLPDLAVFRDELDALRRRCTVTDDGWGTQRLAVMVRADDAPLFDLDVIDGWVYLVIHDRDSREFGLVEPEDVQTLVGYLREATATVK